MEAALCSGGALVRALGPFQKPLFTNNVHVYLNQALPCVSGCPSRPYHGVQRFKTLQTVRTKSLLLQVRHLCASLRWRDADASRMALEMLCNLCVYSATGYVTALQVPPMQLGMAPRPARFQSGSGSYIRLDDAAVL